MNANEYVIPRSNSPEHSDRNSFVLLISTQCFQSAKLWPSNEWSRILKFSVLKWNQENANKPLQLRCQVVYKHWWMTTKWLRIINYRLAHDVFFPVEKLYEYAWCRFAMNFSKQNHNLNVSDCIWIERNVICSTQIYVRSRRETYIISVCLRCINGAFDLIWFVCLCVRWYHLRFTIVCHTFDRIFFFIKFAWSHEPIYLVSYG